MEMQKAWQGTKQIMMAVLGGLIVLFAIVNSEAVSVNLLLGQVELSLSLLILISALAGVVFGWLGAAVRGRRKRKAMTADHRDALSAAENDEEWLEQERQPEGVPRSRQ
ncbi:MAG: lipopolysaccharide assembly protein LapA domain-containing protein [Gemmatimonadota bacterium]